MSDIVDKAACPTCHSKNDGHLEVNGLDSQPDDGDISICSYCGTISKFQVTDNTRRLVPIEDGEREGLMDSPDIQRALAIVRATRSMD